LFTYSPLVAAPRHFAMVRVTSADPVIIDKIADAVRGHGHWVEPISLRNMRAFTSATSRGAVRVQIVVIAVVLFVGLIGNFGAASFSVRERTRTIGIRRALGATRRQIIRYFLEENLLVTTGGIVIGLPIAVAVATAAEHLETSFILEWQHLVLAALFFYCTSLWAAHAPALKAARIPPSVVSQAA
jgi:putative ABC transport system permease protein